MATSGVGLSALDGDVDDFTLLAMSFLGLSRDILTPSKMTLRVLHVHLTAMVNTPDLSFCPSSEHFERKPGMQPAEPGLLQSGRAL